jgi:hypothetical protein
MAERIGAKIFDHGNQGVSEGLLPIHLERSRALELRGSFKRPSESGKSLGRRMIAVENLENDIAGSVQGPGPIDRRAVALVQFVRRFKPEDYHCRLSANAEQPPAGFLTPFSTSRART